jgi:hypothetical protein
MNSTSKKTKIPFVSAEGSKQDKVNSVFKAIYDGIKKKYPNGLVMIFIPIADIHKSNNDLHQKIIFNHENFIGDESYFSIGDLQNPNTLVLLKNGTSITLRHLLKSIPASEGMSRPQLFYQVEKNSGAHVTIIMFQSQDHDLVMDCQASLENEICQVLASDQSQNAFINDSEGIWFGAVTKTKEGNIKPLSSSASKPDIVYSSHINCMLHSPPKKRVLNLPKWGGGIPNTAAPPTPSPWPFSMPTSSPKSSISSDVDAKFESIRIEMNNQRDCNARFDARISSLELSTQSIDSKLDLILARLAPPSSPTSPTHKM